MAFQKVCEQCGEAFSSVWKKAKYCQRTCANKARGEQVRIHTRPQMREYFLAHLPPDMYGHDEACWEWQGTKQNTGYGLARIDKTTIVAHRLAYILFVGPIPDGMFVLHEPVICHNRACVNPKHLRCGTKQDNAMDALIDGTKVIGIRHHNAKFTPEDIRAIRQEYANGEASMEKIAQERKVNFITIRDIIRADTWKHVDPDTYVPPPKRVDKLSHEDVCTIRQMRQSGAMLKDIAASFSHYISLAHISAICSGKTHTDVL